MTMSLRRTLACLALLHAAAAPAWAESLASSASSGASASVGSLSDSLRGSSDSSSPNRVAEGDYRVIDVALIDAKPGLLRVTLAPAAAEGGQTLTLDLPQPVAQASRLVPGAIVAARSRPYGIEFANGQPQRPFFLVLADEWYRELHSRPL